VIIPNWNGAALLKPLLASLRSQEGVGEVIIVDNGSTDNSLEVAREAGARVIELRSNAGFAAAVNRGIEASTGVWLVILNNDVELGSHWVKSLITAANSAGAWFATGKLLDSRRPELIEGTYDAICAGATAWRCGAGRPDQAFWNREQTIRMAPFTAILVRNELFDRVGLLGEAFESYLEDIDFGLRCAIKGFSGIYVPSAVGYHRGSATLGRWHPSTIRRISRNQVLLVARHYPAGWIFRCGWRVLVAQGLWGLVAMRHGAVWPWILGKLEGLRIFRAHRGAGDRALFAILEKSENEIRELQRQTGQDLYWKLYFALT
jgi:GT2 family glycosyltransferase